MGMTGEIKVTRLRELEPSASASFERRA